MSETPPGRDRSPADSGGADGPSSDDEAELLDPLSSMKRRRRLASAVPPGAAAGAAGWRLCLTPAVEGVGKGGGAVELLCGGEELGDVLAALTCKTWLARAASEADAAQEPPQRENGRQGLTAAVFEQCAVLLL